MKSKIILAIETSCDDTSIALVKCSGGLKRPSFKVLGNIVSSQVKIHRPFGGVVPNLAKREHIKNLPKILKLISKNYKLKTINYVVVTVGPGLEPALWTGINFAQELSEKLKKPLLGINHIEGHLYSGWLAPTGKIPNSPPAPRFAGLRRAGKFPACAPLCGASAGRQIPNKFPAIALIVSGGHTILLFMKSATEWTKLGETLDDAAGESFDKVARMLKLPYPGGPEIEKLSKQGNPNAIKFPRPLLNRKDYNFSFSGLKTSVLYYLRDHQTWTNTDTRIDTEIPYKSAFSQNKSVSSPRKSVSRADVAASFQQAVFDVLVKKTLRAAEEFSAKGGPASGGKIKSIMLSGGVSANKTLREELRRASETAGKKFFAPSSEFNTDNAAMIAAAAYINLLNKKHNWPEIKADSNLSV